MVMNYPEIMAKVANKAAFIIRTLVKQDINV